MHLSDCAAAVVKQARRVLQQLSPRRLKGRGRGQGISGGSACSFLLRCGCCAELPSATKQPDKSQQVTTACGNASCRAGSRPVACDGARRREVSHREQARGRARRSSAARSRRRDRIENRARARAGASLAPLALRPAPPASSRRARSLRARARARVALRLGRRTPGEWVAPSLCVAAQRSC